ncbi:21022_t:CDS:2 [Cetraspora pellucida]|uniref:21022_t:CDS:1 n=1 Tax=Cetraspora pellucida TaxID=1433469 RepID=A0A9N9NJ73_9GLOM|nr:21022_t:CDS:2 [Cetraspora pellucida]
MNYEYTYQSQLSDLILLDITTEINRSSNNKSIVNENNTDNYIIEIFDKSFRNWNAVNIAINTYAKQNSFVVIKMRKDLNSVNKTIVQHHVYIKVIEDKLNKKAQYSQIRNYYKSNLLVSFLSIYDTIFKDINSVLKEYLAFISLSLQKAQMKQLLLYQEMIITFNQVEESNNEPSGIIEHIYNRLQIRLHNLLSDIDEDEI